jgi:hypothetical protein
MQTTTLQTSRKLIEMGFKNEGQGFYSFKNDKTEQSFFLTPNDSTDDSAIKRFTLCELLEKCPVDTYLVLHDGLYTCANNEYKDSLSVRNPCEAVAEFLMKNNLIRK